jgi:hypothetical protein
VVANLITDKAIQIQTTTIKEDKIQEVVIRINKVDTDKDHQITLQTQICQMQLPMDQELVYHQFLYKQVMDHHLTTINTINQ